ncbi:MAG TPA: hypothetical protein VJ785_16530 [Anaerolineales bacterium]|nr:hypothetical protein [Anaerolineales bacterium]
MTIPALLFALLIAVFYGCLYHLVRDGGFWRLILYLFLSVFGFALGHLIGAWRGWVWLPLGSINLGLSTIGSFVMLLLGDWLTRIEMQQESKV